MSLLFKMLSRFVMAFLPRSKHLLISWLQSLFTIILEDFKNKTNKKGQGWRSHPGAWSRGPRGPVLGSGRSGNTNQKRDGPFCSVDSSTSCREGWQTPARTDTGAAVWGRRSLPESQGHNVPGRTQSGNVCDLKFSHKVKYMKRYCSKLSKLGFNSMWIDNSHCSSWT